MRHTFGDDAMFAVIHQDSCPALLACRFGKSEIKAAWKEKEKAGITNCRQFAAVILDDGGFSEVSV